MPEAADLLKLRKAVAKGDGKSYLAMTAALKRGKLALGNETRLTRIPKGFEALKGGPLDGAIRLKSFIVEQPLAARLIVNRGLADDDS